MVLNDLNPFGNQKAVYASSDALWAMFFAIIDRQHFDLTITNACIRLVEPGGQVRSPSILTNYPKNLNQRRTV